MTLPSPDPTPPTVSVGVPLYNAERFLADALAALAAQTLADVEIVLSDNASTDRTEAICRAFAAADPRARYVRHPRNRGAIWNFDFVRRQARGEFYMWAAFDDLRHPGYLAACVAALRADPAAVLCCTGVRVVDEDGAEVPGMTRGLRPVGSLAARVRAVARSDYWYDFYGLHRTAVLNQVGPLERTWGFDVVSMMNVCLRGPAVAVPELLFDYRVFRNKSATDVSGTLTATPPSPPPPPPPASVLDGAATLASLPKVPATVVREPDEPADGADALPEPPLVKSFGQLGWRLAASVWRAPIPGYRKPALLATLVWGFCVRNPSARRDLVLELLAGVPAARGPHRWPILLATVVGAALAAGPVAFGYLIRRLSGRRR